MPMVSSVILLLCGILAGCEAMSQPFPDKDFFAIDAGAPTSPAAQPMAGTVRVRPLRIAQPYDGRTFVYKVGPSKYKTDYYNSFIASPDQLLTSELTRWLSETKPFAAVVDSAGEAAHRYVLDGIVSELYGDYTDPQKPKAAIQAKSFLLDDSRAETAVVMQKTYREEVPLAKPGPESLAVGLGQAWRGVLTDLDADLSQAKLELGAGPAR